MFFVPLAPNGCSLVERRSDEKCGEIYFRYKYRWLIVTTNTLRGFEWRGRLTYLAKAERRKKGARGSWDHNRGDWPPRNVSSKSSNSFRKYAGISRLAFMAWDLCLYPGEKKKIHVSMNTASCTYSVGQLSIRYANPLRKENWIRKRITCQIPVTSRFLLRIVYCSGFLRERLANEESFRTVGI